MTWKDILKEGNLSGQTGFRFVGSRENDLAQLEEEAKTPSNIADEVVETNTSEEFAKETEGWQRGGFIDHDLDQLRAGKLSQAKLDRYIRPEHKGRELKYIQTEGSLIQYYYR